MAIPTPTSWFGWCKLCIAAGLSSTAGNLDALFHGRHVDWHALAWPAVVGMILYALRSPFPGTVQVPVSDPEPKGGVE